MWRPLPLWMLPVLSHGSQVHSRDTFCIQWTVSCCSPVSEVRLWVTLMLRKSCGTSLLFLLHRPLQTKSGSLTFYILLNRYVLLLFFPSKLQGVGGGLLFILALEPLTTCFACPSTPNGRLLIIFAFNKSVYVILLTLVSHSFLWRTLNLLFHPFCFPHGNFYTSKQPSRKYLHISTKA